MIQSFDIRHPQLRPLSRDRNPGDFWSEDPGAVGDYVSSRLAPHSLQVRDSGCTAVELRALSLKSAAFYTVQYNKDAVIEGVSAPDVYLLQGELPARPGDPDWQSRAGACDFQIISPGQRFQLRKRADARYLVLKLARESVEARFRANFSVALTDSIRFDAVLGTGHEAPPFIREIVAHICDQVSLFPSLLSDTKIEEHYTNLVAEILLKFIRTNYSATIETQGQEVLPWHVHRAREIIEAAVKDGAPVSVADIATEVGVCARTLQSGFRRFLGQKPVQYIRAVKLEMLHEKLRAADERGRVTDLMTECGIYDFGRFARLYRMTYGRSPSEELRKLQH